MEWLILLVIVFVLRCFYEWIIWILNRGWRVKRTKRVRREDPNAWRYKVRVRPPEERRLEQAKKNRDKPLEQRFQEETVMRELFPKRHRVISERWAQQDRDILDINFYDRYKDAIQNWRDISDRALLLEAELWEMTSLSNSREDKWEMKRLLRNPPDKYKPLFVKHYRDSTKQ